MKWRGVFSIFLVLVLLTVGVYYITNVNSAGFTISSPTSNQYVRGNFTFTISNFNTSYTNVTGVIIYNITGYNVTVNGINNTNALINYTNKGDSFTSLSISVNTNTNYTDGNYTITIQTVNSSFGNAATGLNADYANSTTNITVLIDNTRPTLRLVYPNVSQTFINNNTLWFAWNLTDAMSSNLSGHAGAPLNCTLFVDGTALNRSITVSNLTKGHTDGTAVDPARPLPSEIEYYGNRSFWMNITSTTINSGYHTWNVTCWDNAGNYNDTANWPHQSVGVGGSAQIGGNFTLSDTQAPGAAGTPTFSASSVVKDISLVITCVDGTDGISANPLTMISVRAPNGEWQNGLGSSPHTFTGTNIVGTYSARCYSVDTAGNLGGNSAETTFAVTAPTTSASPTTTTGPGGGGPIREVNVYAGQSKDLGDIVGGQGIINAYRASTVTFSTTSSSTGSASSHSIVFDDVDYIESKVTITISSDPITLTLNAGDSENVDLDADGVDDLEVTLNSIDENGQVNMNIQDIIGTASVEEEEPVFGEEPTPSIGESAGMAWYWWVIIIIVVVVIIALILPKRKK